MLYSAEELKSLIEPILYIDINKEVYESKVINPIQFLTHKRFDLAFKLFYLDERHNNPIYARYLYEQHIKAFSLGKYREPGNKEKTSIEDFFFAFDKIFQNFQEYGFNNTKTLIPISKNKLLGNGAHRVASAIYLKQNVECVEIETHDQVYDYKFFANLGVSENILDSAALKYIEFSENIYIAFLWPSAVNNRGKVERKIPNIIYKKKIKLNLDGAHNLLTHIYENEDWLGTLSKNFPGVRVKVMECFKNFNPLYVYLFQCEKHEEVIEIKQTIRDLYDLGKHSIHITDTKEEVIRLSRYLFNNNSIHFLNYGKPYINHEFDILLDKFRRSFKNQFDSEKILLCGESTLSIYGVYPKMNLNFLSYNNKEDDHRIPNFKESRNSFDKLEIGFNELLFNPRNYFYYKSFKLLSFENSIRYIEKNKMNRVNLNEIDALFFEVNKQNQVSKYRIKIYYLRAKLRQLIVVFLKKIGLARIVKKIMNKLNLL